MLAITGGEEAPMMQADFVTIAVFVILVLLMQLGRKTTQQGNKEYSLLVTIASAILWGIFFDFGMTALDTQPSAGWLHAWRIAILVGGTVYYFCALRSSKTSLQN